MARKANTKNTTNRIKVVRKDSKKNEEVIMEDNNINELNVEEELTEVGEDTIIINDEPSTEVEDEEVVEEVTEEPKTEEEPIVIEEEKAEGPTIVDEQPIAEEVVEKVEEPTVEEEEKKEENNNNRVNTRINNMFGYLWNGQEMDY